MEDPNHPDNESVIISPLYSSAATKESMVTVLFKFCDGRQAYQFTFDISNDKSIVKRFMDALERSRMNLGAIPIASSSIDRTKEEVEHRK